MEQPTWPEGRRCAAMFSFDLDGDTTWENGNKGMPNGEKYIRSRAVGRYGPKRSADMILELLERHGVRGTFFIPGLTAERFPDVVRRVAAAGHEIGLHGYAHERFAGKTVPEQIEIIEKSMRILEDLTGAKPKGFRTPSGDWSVETPGLLRERGVEYSSSMRGDDKPYRTVIDGAETDFIEIPTKWELDDYVAMAYNYYPAEPRGQDRIACYRDVQENIIAEFDGTRRFGLSIAFMFHPQVIGSPGRIRILDALLSHVKRQGDVWIATGVEIADWYRAATNGGAR